MTRRLHALVVAIAALLPVGAPAMDLVQAYQEALATDPAVASARAQLGASREQIPQARAGLLPSIGAGAAVTRQSVDTNVADRRMFTSENYAINLAYPLFRLQNVELYEQTRLAAAISETQFEQARQDLAVRVAQAYFDVLAAQDNVATIRAQKAAITEQLAAAKRNFEVGTATVTDQQEAQARYDLTLAQEYAAENALEVARAALAQLIGRPVPTLRTLGPGVEMRPPEPARESEWTESARQNNLTVQQAQVAAEIARREIDRQRYGHYPTVDLVGQIGHVKNSSANFLGIKSNNAAVGVQLNVPLYAGGAINAAVREAALLRDKAQYDLDDARRQVEQAARTAFLGVNSGLAQVRALEAAERSSQLALDSNQLGYQVGVRINIDVLNAQQQLFTTRRDLARARYDVLVNGLRLKATAGTLSEEDLQQVDALLTADAATVVTGSGTADGAPPAASTPVRPQLAPPPVAPTVPAAPSAPLRR